MFVSSSTIKIAFQQSYHLVSVSYSVSLNIYLICVFTNILLALQKGCCCCWCCGGGDALIRAIRLAEKICGLFVSAYVVYCMFSWRWMWIWAFRPCLTMHVYLYFFRFWLYHCVFEFVCLCAFALFRMSLLPFFCKRGEMVVISQYCISNVVVLQSTHYHSCVHTIHTGWCDILANDCLNSTVQCGHRILDV